MKVGWTKTDDKLLIINSANVLPTKQSDNDILFFCLSLTTDNVTKIIVKQEFQFTVLSSELIVVLYVYFFFLNITTDRGGTLISKAFAQGALFQGLL